MCEAKQLPVLVIDEAQHLRNDVLEDLRLLCNYELAFLQQIAPQWVRDTRGSLPVLPSSSSELDLDSAEATEDGAYPIALRDLVLPGERPRHDQVAGAQSVAERRQLARQPDHRVDWGAQNLRAERALPASAVDEDLDLDGRGVGIVGKRDEFTGDERALLRVSGKRQRQVLAAA